MTCKVKLCTPPLWLAGGSHPTGWFLPSSRVKGGEREEVKMEWGGNGIGVKELVEIN